MAEQAPIQALSDTPSPFPVIQRTGLTLYPETRLGLGKALIHGTDAGSVFQRLTGRPPPAPGRQTDHDGLTIAWMAPGEWLLAGGAAAVTAALTRCTEQGGDTVLAVDLTHARSSFRLDGTQARTALAAHCPLDLWEGAFPVGAVARSLLGDAGLFIARLDDQEGAPCFRIIVDQTMAAYAVRLLADTPPFSGVYR